MHTQINTYAIRNIFRRKARTLFAIVGIAVGISAVIALVAISNGLLDAIKGVLLGFPGEVLVVSPAAVGLEHSRISEDDAEIIGAVDGVTWSEPFIFQVPNFPLGEIVRMSGIPVPDDEELPNQILPVYGLHLDRHMVSEYPATTDETVPTDMRNFVGPGFSGPEAEGEVLMGWMIVSGIRERVRLTSLPAYFPQDKVSSPWKIVGTFRTGGIQDTALVVPYRTLQEFAHMEGKCSAVLIKTNDVDGVIKRINELAPTRFKAMRAEEFLNQFKANIEQLQAMVFAIGFIAAIAGAIGVLNTMMSNVHERTREIGLLQAVGWTRMQLMMAIMVEGFVLSAIGGILAIPLGHLLIYSASRMIGFDLVTTGIDPSVYGFGIALALGLGLAGSLLPAWRASRLSPVEALREA